MAFFRLEWHMTRRTQGSRYLFRLLSVAVLTLGLGVQLAAAAQTGANTAKAKTKASQPATKDKKAAANTRKGQVVAGKPNERGVAKSAARKTGQTQAAAAKSRSGAHRQVVAKRGQKAVPERNARAVAQTKTSSRVHANAKQEGRKTSPVRAVAHVSEPPRQSAGERLGLRAAHDPLDLSASVALVVDQETSEVLFSKNDTAVLPIASLTKLMTGLVIADANLSLDEPITITEEDAMVYRTSRLGVGTTLSRGELMHLALMSSENRAANALGRTFPGGSEQFVRRMNAKAVELGMLDTRYVEPTGLSSRNQSSARDLATLVSAAYERPILRDLSTTPSHQLDLGRKTLQYNNSNRLIRSPDWDIGLQKTGYISEAGRCLVMQARVAGRQLIMVFLDSAGKLSRAQDAERVRRWVEAQSIRQQFERPQG
jgi:D-alanyl-D-alanine endopeptidase (penicillin-binding protein 7)